MAVQSATGGNPNQTQALGRNAHPPVRYAYLPMWNKTNKKQHKKTIFFFRARCLSAGLRSWVLLADQRGIEPPPAVCQRQECRDTNCTTRTTKQHKKTKNSKKPTGARAETKTTITTATRAPRRKPSDASFKEQTNSCALKLCKCNCKCNSIVCLTRLGKPQSPLRTPSARHYDTAD